MQRLEGILRELYPELDLSADVELIEDGILDSLDIVTLVTDINEAYRINIGAEDITPENFNRISDICKLIRRRGGEICRL